METENGRNSVSIETVLKEPINQDSKTLDDLQCPILSCSATRAGIQDLEVTSNIAMRNFEDQVLTANEEKGKWIFFVLDAQQVRHTGDCWKLSGVLNCIPLVAW